MTTPFLAAMAAHFAPQLYSIEEAVCATYACDETEDLRQIPALVFRPETAAQIARFLVLAGEHNLPVTPRGAGSGLAGGAIPQAGGLVLSMERFNRLIEIDERNLQVRVEAGVITQVLQEAVQAKGLFYPPDPASRGTCYIGGNINTNAGGPRAVKYGVVKDYVLNLEVVLPTGEIIWTGANTLKNSTGYNLTQLMVGSEGTLGIITQAVLRLIPYPSQRLLLLADFPSAEQACAAVSAIFRAGITPSALEFMEREALLRAQAYLGEDTAPLAPEVQAQLLIEVDGNYAEALMQDCEQIAQVLADFEVGEIRFADSEAQQAQLWRLRRCIGHAVKQGSYYKEEDTVVPRAELPQLLAGVKAIGQRYGFESVCYGHAGDGNLHVNILRGQLSEQAWREEVPKGIREIFALVKSLGGTISGEHGIGLVQRPYLDIVFEPIHRQLMQAIKQSFDPKGILNPGKAI